MITNNLFCGDCIDILSQFDNNYFDMIFADPPYNLSGNSYITVQNGKPVKCYKGSWDEISDLSSFNKKWLTECIRVLSDTGTIWISGTLHNHPNIGVLLKELNMWIINDVIWYKNNATPLLAKTRFVPSTELIWLASKTKKYYFDYDTAKSINNGKQMKNLWEINAQRHLTSHPTEKPESLLERIITIGSKRGDRVLDPFMGSGTTGVVASRMGRLFYGIEISPEYYKIALDRIQSHQSEIVM